MPLCLVFFFFFFFFFFGLVLGKIVPTDCAFCFVLPFFFFFFFFFLFLARRHALIRDAPDDLYFSPPCFFLFAT